MKKEDAARTSFSILVRISRLVGSAHHVGILRIWNNNVISARESGSMDLLNSIPLGMKDGLMRAAETVKGHGKVRIISHYDADGISSAVIVRKALSRAGVATECTILRTLSEAEIGKVLSIDAECIVMTDMGTSYLSELSGKGWDIVILDHHRIQPGYDIPSRKGFCFVSPLSFGIDGSKNACGSAMAFLFALAMDASNEDLVPFSVAGMFGDRQNLGGFESIDKAIVDFAVERGHLRAIENLAYPSTLTFNDAMMSCYEPYFRDFTGVQDKVNRFVKSCGLMPYDTPATVSQDAIDRFSDAVRQRMIRDKVPEETRRNAFSTRYYSPEYDVDVTDLSMILDGCGREELYEEAFEACDTGEFTDARAASERYNVTVMEAIGLAYESLVSLENIQYFVGRGGGINGNVAGVLIRFLADPEKPVIGLAHSSNGVIDVSSRGSEHLVSRGLDLSDAMRRCCAAAGGQGGGHIIAAGGTFPESSGMDGFLAHLDKVVGEQFAAGRRA